MQPCFPKVSRPSKRRDANRFSSLCPDQIQSSKPDAFLSLEVAEFPVIFFLEHAGELRIIIFIGGEKA
jgi:hypothetical protein